VLTLCILIRSRSLPLVTDTRTTPRRDLGIRKRNSFLLPNYIINYKTSLSQICMNEVVVNLIKLHTLLISVQFVKLNWMFEQGVDHKYLKYRFGVSLSNWGTRSVAAGHNEADSISTIPRKRQKRTKTDTVKHFLCKTTQFTDVGWGRGFDSRLKYGC
jgi:hypothetical protein